MSTQITRRLINRRRHVRHYGQCTFFFAVLCAMAVGTPGANIVLGLAPKCIKPESDKAEATTTVLIKQ